MEARTGETTSLAEVVERIRIGEGEGLERLYSIFARGIRFYFWRHLGSQDLEDRVHDTFLIVVQAIQRGDLREPERLAGFVRTIVRRQVAAQIDKAVHNRKQQAEFEPALAVADEHYNPEEDVLVREQRDLMLQVLRELSERDRDILTRFYLLGQTQDRICREMDLTDTQFRLLKSRAKARFGELGRRKLKARPAEPLAWMMTSELRESG